MANSALLLRIEEQYVEHLVDILAPSLYSSMTQLYEQAVHVATKSGRPNEVIGLFQNFLAQVDDWNQTKLNDITTRIKADTNSTTYLDNLIRCVVKSNIVLLSYANQVSESIGQRFYDNLSTTDFLHKCYSICANDAYNNPWLFQIYVDGTVSHQLPALEIRRNMLVIKANIDLAIKKAVRKMMPLELLTQEFLTNTIGIINKGYQVELVGSVPSNPQTRLSPAKFMPTANLAGGLGTKDKKIPSIAQHQDIDALMKSEASKSPAEKVKSLMALDAKSDEQQKKLLQQKKSSEKSRDKIPTGSKQKHTSPKPKTYADEDIDDLGEEFEDQETVDVDDDDDDDIGELALTTSTGGKGMQIVLDSNKTSKTKPVIHNKMEDFGTERVTPGHANVVERYGKSSKPKPKKG
jgi:hypothetical protein